MKRVEIFRTNVIKNKDVREITLVLLAINAHYKINFDLEDEDKVLRVEVKNHTIAIDQIIKSIAGMGYFCQLIE